MTPLYDSCLSLTRVYWRRRLDCTPAEISDPRPLLEIRFGAAEAGRIEARWQRESDLLRAAMYLKMARRHDRSVWSGDAERSIARNLRFHAAEIGARHGLSFGGAPP